MKLRLIRSCKPSVLGCAARFRRWPSMKPPRALMLLLAVTATGCSRPAPPDPLCSVVAHPERYLGQRLTLAGIAQMYQHASTLRSDSCPREVLFLEIEPYPPSSTSGEGLPASAAFFTKLATRPGSVVAVTGRVARSQIESSPYVFVVESGSYR